MVKYFLYSKLLITVILVLNSCNPDPSGYQEKPQDSSLPVWTTRLPGQAGIYNDGLTGLPVYKNLILFHSTYFTGIQGEDNRIHALDLETGEIKWTFPEKYDSANPMFFWGVPYIFQNLMVCKMSAWPGQTNCDRIICLNLDTHEIVWKIVLPEEISAYASRDIAGNEERFYFIQRSEQGNYIFEGDIFTGKTRQIYHTTVENPDTGTEITTNCNLLTDFGAGDLLHFATRERQNGIVTQEVWNVLDCKRAEIVRKVVVKGDDFYSINNGQTLGKRIFFTCGRKAWCYDYERDSIIWEFFDRVDFDFTAPLILVSDNTVFLMGTNRYMGLNAVTGELRYKFDTECANAAVFGNRVYLIGRDAQLHVIDLINGVQKMTIQNPDKTTAFPFALGCKPKIFNNRIYLFGNFRAYCYPLIPD